MSCCNKFEAEVDKVAQALAPIDKRDSRQAEAGVRALGELLGFTATRPDNDEGTGPDVLWRDDATQRQLGFELKTDKKDPATYFKKDISQGHDHLQWMAQTYPQHASLGLLFVGPAGKPHAQANPSGGHEPVPAIIAGRHTRRAAGADRGFAQAPADRAPDCHRQ